EPALRVDEDALAEDAARREAAVGVGPPLVAITAAGLADAGALGRRFGQPAVGHDAAVTDARAVQDEEAEACEVPRRGLQAAAADLLAGAAEDPRRLLLHARRHPDLLRLV